MNETTISFKVEEGGDRVRTENEAMLEALNFLDHRKTIMDNPYVVVGKNVADKLGEHFQSLGETYTTEKLSHENFKFMLTSAK